MGIHVEAPDGRVFDVNAATEDEARAKVRTYIAANPAPARQAPMRNVTPRAYNGTLPQRATAMLRGLTLNANDELGGATAGLLEGGRAALEGDFQHIAPRARHAFDTTAERIRGIGDDYQREHPVTAAMDEIGGGLLLGGAGALRAAPTAVAPTLTRQVLQGAGAGAGYGAAYGFNDRGDLSQRLTRAGEGGAIGAALGAAVPLASTGAGLLARAAREPLSRLPRLTVDPNAVGMNGGNIRLRPPPPRTAAARPPSGPINRGLTLADRARLSADDLAERARTSPESAAVVDLFGDAGTRTLRPIAQAPGQTGDLAREVADRRFADAPTRIVNALRQRLNVGESKGQAIARLGREYDAASAENYQPLWRRPIPAEARQALERRLAPYADDPVFERARDQAESIFARDRRNGLVTGDVEDNFARWAHYMKLGLDDAAKLSSNPATSGGIGPTQLRGIKEMRARIISAIDESIPGYRAARERWGGLINAEEALDTGSAWVRMLPDEVTASRAEMTPFELEHARIGLADEIRHLVRGQVVGNKNVANAINDPDMQRAIANAFDSPEQAAEFLDIVNSSNRLMRNAQQWGGGSQTAGNQAYQADGVAAAVADYGGDLVTGKWGQAVNRAGRQISNAALGNIVERSNNEFGRELLRPASSDEARAFVGEMVRIMRVREATRRGSSAASAASRPATSQDRRSKND